MSKNEYLTDLREEWRRIPDAPTTLDEEEEVDTGFFHRCVQGIFGKSHGSKKNKKDKKDKKEEYLKKIGGKWAERYSVSLVTASVVPNYFPTFRIIEYNVSGLFDQKSVASPSLDEPAESTPDSIGTISEYSSSHDQEGAESSKKRHKKKKHHKKSKHTFTPPSPPPSSAAPGPAYSPQPLTWLSYKQYFANLTRINPSQPSDTAASPIQPDTTAPHSKIELNRSPHEKKEKPIPFEFELEYDTATDSIYRMPDLTVRSWVGLARRIGKYRPTSSMHKHRSKAQDITQGESASQSQGEAEGMLENQDKSGVGSRSSEGRLGEGRMVDGVKTIAWKKGDRKRKKEIERLWYTFVSLAYVGTMQEEELREKFA